MDEWVAFVSGAVASADTGQTDGLKFRADALLQDIPVSFELEGNYPNPFNPQTTIRFGLPEPARIRLVVYDAIGRHVYTLLDGFMEAGRHEVEFNAGSLPSGSYLYRLETPEGSTTKSMLLAK